MSRRKGSSRFPEAVGPDARAALERIAADPATKLTAALQAAHVLRGDPGVTPGPRAQPAPPAGPPANDAPAADAPIDATAETVGERPEVEYRATAQGALDRETSDPDMADRAAPDREVPGTEHPDALPPGQTSALPRTGMPRRDRIVAPIAEVQTTLATFARSEAEHALAHAGDLLRARSVTEVADLQVSALVRATGASLDCFATLMRTVTGSPGRRGEGS